MNNDQFQDYTKRVDELVQRVTALPESEARTLALELLQSVMDLHGVVVSRIVELLSSDSDAGRKSLGNLGEDPLVCGLLVLYGVHPAGTEERIRRAIERLRPQLQKFEARVEFVGVAGGTVRLKAQSEGHGFLDEKLKSAIEQAVLEAAPEAIEVVTEGLRPAGFVPANMIQPAIQKEERIYEESAT
jgi:Fe-S cluster biogenesis protein NfuA